MSTTSSAYLAAQLRARRAHGEPAVPEHIRADQTDRDVFRRPVHPGRPSRAANAAINSNGTTIQNDQSSAVTVRSHRSPGPSDGRIHG